MKRAISSIGWGVTVVAAFGLLIAYSWGEGVWSGRWQRSDASKVAAARLAGIPKTVGSWNSVEGEFDERQLLLGELDGYLYRIYANETTGETVQVLIVCGRPGPVSLHTPDVCYRGLGYLPLSTPARKPLVEDFAGRNAQCWSADFDKATPLGHEYLRIGWTWFAKDGWQAADQPRLEFAQESALFKMYLIHPVSQPDSPWNEDAIPRLAQDLLPVLTKHLLGEAEADDVAEPAATEVVSVES